MSEQSTAGAADQQFVVLRNAEDQYALWAADLAVPVGWSVAAPPASRAVALAYVDAQWSDMRPLSLRRLMQRPE